MEARMTLREFLDQVTQLPPDTQICVAEENEAFGMNVANLEVVRDARRQKEEADGTEAVELGNGGETVVVMRW
jgi:hypothetical protein